MMKEPFFSAHSSYYGKLTPENLVFNANLQEFAQKIGIISALETGGKISPVESYNRAKALWEEFDRTSQGLGI